MKDQPSQENQQHNLPAVPEAQSQPLDEKPRPESATEEPTPAAQKQPEAVEEAGDTSATDLEFHPWANVFPMLEGQEYDQLRDDIGQKGQIDPILITREKLGLDGRNRFRACRELGIEPRFETTDAPPDQWCSIIISKNLHRRHLTTSQRAASAADLVTTKHGDNGRGRPANLPVIDQPRAAAMFGVSERHVRNAIAIKSASQELHKAIKAKTLTVGAATAIARHGAAYIRKLEEGVKAGKTLLQVRKEIDSAERAASAQEILARTEAYADWLLGKIQTEQQFETLVSWIQNVKRGDIISALEKKREALSENRKQKPTAKQGNGAIAKRKKPMAATPPEASKAPSEAEGQAKPEG